MYPGLETEKTTRVIMLTQQCCFLCIVAIEGKQRLEKTIAPLLAAPEPR
jgi:hypothetical protein